MKSIEVKLSYLSLLLLLLLCFLLDRCESQYDYYYPRPSYYRSLPRNFLMSGDSAIDDVVDFGSNNCAGAIDIPYEIFDSKKLYVSVSLLRN